MVLDEQMTLLARSTTPTYSEMAAEMLSSILAKSHMLGPEWAAKARQHTRAHWLEMVVPSIENACAYHVSTEMLTLAQWAGHLLPEDVALEPEMVPTASGFLMFEDALVGMEVWGRTTYTHAILWRPIASKYLDYQKGAGIEIYSFNSFRDVRDEVTQKILAEYKERGRNPMEHFAALGHLQIDHIIAVPYGEKQPAMVHTPEGYAEGWTEDRRTVWAEGRSPIPDNENWIRTIIAIFTLMNQTVADTREVEVDRKTAKRARRMNLPGRVTIIHLRRMEGSKSDHESDVEWQHRWVCRGHWRNQRFGPGLTEVRRLWIAPYIKGPEGKPLIISEKVYSLHR
jgi:hypothetical protein